MNYTNDDELIAKFMGAILNKSMGWQFFVFNSPYSRSGFDLKFHSSWDWLVPVVEKIESLKVSVNINTQWNEFNQCSYTQTSMKLSAGKMSKDKTCICDSIDLYHRHSSTYTSKIESVYESVVEFIKWYNENK
jgi:hypothetical protein